MSRPRPSSSARCSPLPRLRYCATELSGLEMEPDVERGRPRGAAWAAAHEEELLG